MSLLYCWHGEKPRYDLDMGAAYHLNQANPLGHQIELGESLLALTRASHGPYVLVTE